MSVLRLDIPVIETERLILRGPEERDFDAVAAFFTEERSSGFGGPIDRNKAWRWFAGNIGHWAMRGYGFWSVETKVGDYVGMVGMWAPEGWPEPEIGWFAASTTTEGKGYIREAAEAARDHAYGPMGWATLISLIYTGVDRSQALAERMGATYEADWEFADGESTRIFRHPSPEMLADQGRTA